MVTAPDGSHVHVMPDGTVVRHAHAHAQNKLAPARAGGAAPLLDLRGAAAKTPQAAARTHTEELALHVLAKNDALAQRNRAWFAAQRIFAVNVMSSPGSGKTRLLERTVGRLTVAVTVLEGDQETANDADRIRAAGGRAVQINTGKGCHLEADMVHVGLQALRPESGSIVVIENVGNLVCPALFDLGEAARVVLFSVTEGEDKPRKYPHMFQAADLVVFTKVDLLPHVDFDMNKALAAIAAVRPGTPHILTSARDGTGLDAWFAWLERGAAERVAHE